MALGCRTHWNLLRFFSISSWNSQKAGNGSICIYIQQIA
ncbi:hypothetical protein TREAZ_1333 [Leadbettera azotonutricia ZAS-9]|uniref:Uncharacterized protein n=1 Tax=Leadbettera azotonutricia (strain ATCC BAA-888 / DSM 13862 / ZAS-9) TaxID=545695 RepID=F5YFX4_LEAAZ|nr:hypothetical protein TREAZ_1333 [Leadbettera azotonutricia ZAS-9]